MADIQMVYIEGKCDLNLPEFCEHYCLTDRAEFTDCQCYCGQLVLRDDKGSFIKNLGGCCIHGQFETKYKGWTGKCYEMEMIDDPMIRTTAVCLFVLAKGCMPVQMSSLMESAYTAKRRCPKNDWRMLWDR